MQEIINTTSEILSSQEFLESVNKNRAPDQHRSSGFLCVLKNNPESKDQSPLILQAVGLVPQNKKERWMNMSQEKAFRLLNSPTHIMTSFETRNPEKDQTGGAIRAGDYILSFSGLTEAGDEQLMRLVAEKCKLA
ncbi:MAG: hypothetical protein V4519_02030 [Patescibacteria group bacterium]